MAQDSADQEPTMEEILASIRRIINEDEEEGQPAEADAEAEVAPEPEPVAEPEPEPEAEPEPVMEAEPEPEPEPVMEEPELEDDVLELTERVEDEDDALGTEPVSMADDLMIVDREPEPEPEPEIEEEPMAEAPVEDDALVDDVPAMAAAGMFAALSDNLRVSEQQGQTLEGIVRELMRPMLKQWLDDNLPAIVEEKVQAEVERIARRSR